MDDAVMPTMEGLFSARVIALCGAPDGAQGPLHPVESARIEQAVEKRRIEFAAGRTLARQALQRLGVGDVAIPVGEKREPLWPPGVVGSISHTKGFCGVAVARAAEVRGLGLDVERVADVRPDLGSHIAGDNELARIDAALGRGPEHALALAFSGKEAFFKCQYPLTRNWIGLLDAELEVEGDGFRVTPRVDLIPVCRRGESIPGRFAFCGGLVLTAVELAP